MKLTLELTEDPEGGFTTKREWTGVNDAPPLFVKIAQRLELAVLQTLDMFSHSLGVGEGKTEDEARIKLSIDRDIQKAGGPTAVNERTPHAHIGVGYCKICGHYGKDCTGKKA